MEEKRKGEGKRDRREIADCCILGCEIVQLVRAHSRITLRSHRRKKIKRNGRIGYNYYL
jgi:hypothetical protein